MARRHGVSLAGPAPAWPLRLSRGDRGLDLAADVFGNGTYAGFYYDFTSLTQVGGLAPFYTVSTGQTAVTASGNTIGLALSQDSGPILGAEKTTNGNFATGNLTGWTQVNGAWWTVTGGRAYMAPTTSYFGIEQNLGAAASSERWLLQFDVEIVQGQLQIDTSVTSNGSVVAQYFFAATASGVRIVVSGANPFIRFGRRSGIGTCEFYLANVSIKNISGNHAYQTTSASRGIWNSGGYWNGDGSDDHLVTGLLPGSDMTIMAAWYPTAPSDAVAGTMAASDTRSLGFGTDASGFATLMLGDASLSTSAIKGNVDIRNTWSVATAIGSSLNGTLRVNGSQVATGATGGSVNTTIAYLVGAFNSNGTAAATLAGRIARILVVKRSNMGADLLLAAEKYLARPNGNFAGIAF